VCRRIFSVDVLIEKNWKTMYKNPQEGGLQPIWVAAEES
jgi:hypothetical protein